MNFFDCRKTAGYFEKGIFRRFRRTVYCLFSVSLVKSLRSKTMMGLRTDSQLTVSGSVQERAMSNNAKIQWFRAIAVFIVCLATVSLFFASRLFEDNYNYAIEQMHSYNEAWYANNINTVGSDFSPRLFANLSMSMLTHIAGGNWNSALLFTAVL